MYLQETIKNIKEKIDNKLKQLKLVPKNPLIEEFILKANNFYITVCFDKNQKEYIFKSSLRDEKKCLLDLIKEIYFHKQITKRFSKKTNFIPKYITSGKVKKFIWILREYIPGQEMGELREINKNLVKKKCIPLLLQEIFFSRELLKKIFFSKSCSIKLPQTTYTFEFYLKEKNKLDYDPFIFKEAIKKYQTEEIDFKKILNLYQKNKKLLVDSLNILVHGDLNPKNLLITPDDKICFIDWERIHWDNSASEIDFLWASAWNNRDWQRELLKQYFAKVKNKEEFAILWRLGIMARCWGESWCWYHRMKSAIDQETIAKCEQAITINLDYLHKASCGFENFL